MRHRVARTAIDLAGLLAITFLLMQLVPGGPVEQLITGAEEWANSYGRPLPEGPIR